MSKIHEDPSLLDKTKKMNIIPKHIQGNELSSLDMLKGMMSSPFDTSKRTIFLFWI